MANEYASEARAMTDPVSVRRGDIEYAEECAMKPGMDRPVVIGIRRIGNACDELAMAVTTLEERLQTVLSKPIPERAAPDPADQHGDSDLTSSLHGHAHNTELQVMRIHRLLNRLEV